jgi:hypothetical protein
LGGNGGLELRFSPLKGRFQDTVHSIFRKIRSRSENISARVLQISREHKGRSALIAAPPGSPGARHFSNSKSTIELDLNEFPDPLIPFRDAFSQLLAPKKLVDPDVKNQQLFFLENEQQLPLASLSSGESEVVNIVFDFLLRNPTDCIVIFDEPELHLHPELSSKLLQTLRNSDNRNQFKFAHILRI